MSSCQSRGKLWWNIWNNKWGWCTQDMTRGLHAKWPDINLSPAGGEREIVNDYLGQNNISPLFLWSTNFQRTSNLCVSALTRGGNFLLKLLEEQFIKIHRVWQPLLIINVISARDQPDPPRPYKQPSEVYNISSFLPLLSLEVPGKESVFFTRLLSLWDLSLPIIS